MANVFEPTPEMIRDWNAWVRERSPAVRAVAERIKPWKLYLLEKGSRVVVYSIDEMPSGKVSLMVDILGQFNLCSFERRVFGVDPDDLTECDLPGKDEPLGALLTQEEVDRIIRGASTPAERMQRIDQAAKEELDRRVAQQQGGAKA